MLSLPDAASINAALHQPLDSDLHSILTERHEQITAQGLGDLTHCVVIRTDDTEADIVDAIGWSPLEASANTQLKYIVALLLLTGCRKRELLDAKWEEFQLDRKMWRIPMQRAKTSKTRHVPLSTAAMEILAQLPRWEGCPYVVPNPKTLKPFWSVYHCWDKARKAAGLPDVRMHDLRHSAASNLVNSGQSLYVVGSILGHAQTKTTQRYAHLDNSTLLSAANAAADHMDTDWSRKTG